MRVCIPSRKTSEDLHLSALDRTFPLILRNAPVENGHRGVEQDASKILGVDTPSHPVRLLAERRVQGEDLLDAPDAADLEPIYRLREQAFFRPATDRALRDTQKTRNFINRR
jgi:hypothetical protein